MSTDNLTDTAAQVPAPNTAADVPGPVTGTAMTKEYVQTVGQIACLWGWPLINQLHRRAAFAQAPEPGRLGDVLPIAPPGYVSMLTDYIKPEQSFVTCPNQDTFYGAGFLSSTSSPSWCRCLTLASASSPTRSLTIGPIRSPRSAYSTAPSRASTF